MPVVLPRVLDGMAGSNGDSWRHTAAAAAEGTWIKSKVLLRVLKRAAGINFGVTTHQANAIKVLDDMSSDEEIVGRSRRFPEDGAYACLDEGEVCRLLGSIRAALAFRETDEMREEKGRVTMAQPGQGRALTAGQVELCGTSITTVTCRLCTIARNW